MLPRVLVVTSVVLRAACYFLVPVFVMFVVCVSSYPSSACSMSNVRTSAYMPYTALHSTCLHFNTPIPSAAVQSSSLAAFPPTYSLDSVEAPHRTCPAPSLPRLAHPNPPEPALNRTPSLTLKH